MKKPYNHLKLICLSIFTAIMFIVLTLQYQRINANYADTKEVYVEKNEQINSKNVKFTIIRTSRSSNNLYVTVKIKQTDSGFYGMKKSNDFSNNMWLANNYRFSEHINKPTTDQYGQKFDLKRYATGQEMIAKVSFDAKRLKKDSKFSFLVPDNKKMTKYSFRLN